jgi:hypothetical protein
LLHFFIVFEHFFESRLASPLPVATQLCFATPSGDAAVLRHSQWRRSLCVLRCVRAQLPTVLRHSQWRRTPASPLTVATQAWIYEISSNLLLNIIYHISNKIIYQRRSYIIYQRRSSSQFHISYIKEDQAHNIIYHISYMIISKKIKLTRSYIIYDHIKEEQAHNIIYHLSYMIISKKIKLTISYIIYDHIKEDQAHNIIYHISKKIIYEIRAHDHIQTSSS